MLTVIQAEISPEVVSYVEANRDRLTKDVSNYAKGRMRAWIGLEAPLTERHDFQKAAFGYQDWLWGWLSEFCNQHLNFDPELGLIHVGGADCSDPEEMPINGRGGECGIRSHRDAGYADFKAVGINLSGTASFGYWPHYPDQDRWSKEQNNPAQPQIVQMQPGTCVVFNCKNPHFGQAGPNRWCINAWRVSKKRRESFEKVKHA